MSTYLFQALIALYLLTAPTIGFGTGLSWHDEQRLGQLGLFVVTCFWLFSPSNRQHLFLVPRLLDRRIPQALCLLTLLGFLSAVSAPLPRWAFLELATIGLLTFLTFALAAIRRNQGSQFDSLGLGVCIAIAAAYLAGVAVAYSAVFFEGLPLFVWQLFHGFSNIRFFGHFQSMTLPLLVLPALIWQVKPYQRGALAVLCSGWWMLAIASGTRGTWLGMGVAFFVSILCQQPGRDWLRAQIKFLLIGTFGYVLFFEALPTLFGIGGSTIASSRLANITSLSGREVLWLQALNMISTHPLLGIGPMHFANYPNGVAAHPHNAILQWAAEWGLPSAALLISGIALGFRSLFRQIRSKSGDDKNHLLRIALFLSLIAASTQSLVDGVIVMPYSQTWLAIIVGWTIGLHLDNAAPWAARGAAPAKTWILLLTLVLCIGIVFYGTHDHIGHLSERQDFFTLKHGGIIMPRYWEQGLIFE